MNRLTRSEKGDCDSVNNTQKSHISKITDTKPGNSQKSNEKFSLSSHGKSAKSYLLINNSQKFGHIMNNDNIDNIRDSYKMLQSIVSFISKEHGVNKYIALSNDRLKLDKIGYTTHKIYDIEKNFDEVKKDIKKAKDEKILIIVNGYSIHDSEFVIEFINDLPNIYLVMIEYDTNFFSRTENVDMSKIVDVTICENTIKKIADITNNKSEKKTIKDICKNNSYCAFVDCKNNIKILEYYETVIEEQPKLIPLNISVNMNVSEEIVIDNSGTKIICNVQLFDYTTICPNSSTLIIGKRGSGKTNLIIDIAAKLKKKYMIDRCVIFSPNDKHQNNYQSISGSQNIFIEPPTSESLRYILDTQSESITESKKCNMPDKKLLVIFDDCLFHLTSKNKEIQELLFNSRHYRITFIVSMQFPILMPPEMRTNFDYIYLFTDDTLSNQKRLYDHYAGMFPTFNSFRQVFTELTSDFGSMVIVNRGIRKALFDKIFYCKSNPYIGEVIFPNDIFSNNIYKNIDKNILINKPNQNFDDKSCELMKNIIDCNYAIFSEPDQKFDQKYDDKSYELIINILNCNNNISNCLSNNKNDPTKISILNEIAKCHKLIVNSLYSKNNILSKQILPDLKSAESMTDDNDSICSDRSNRSNCSDD